MKVLLVFPPQFNPTQPYLSVPSLAARLRQEGIHVVVRDANAEFYQWALTASTVREAVRRLCDASTGHTPVTELATRMGDCLIEHVEAAREFFRSEDEFYDLGRYQWARSVVGQSLSLVGGAWGCTLSLNEFQCCYDYASSCQAANAARDPDRNVTHVFLERRLVESLAAEEPDLVGLSVSSPFQVIGAMTTASLLKSRLPHVPIVLGGGFFTRALHRTLHAPGLVGLADAVVVGEGEEALFRLCETLPRTDAWASVPNVVRVCNDRLVHPDSLHREDMRTLPVPDFRGLPLNLYLSPRPVLPLLTSRGCYWHRCSFCTSYLSYGSHYSARPRGRLLEDIDTLVSRHGTSHFFLADQAVPPVTLRWLADALTESNRKITFYGQTRCDGEFSSAWLPRLRAAGCTKLYFGIESGSASVVERMAKGIDLDQARDVLRLCAEAGIAVHLFFLVGFPGETPEDRARTIEFLESIPEVVEFPGFSMNFAPFGLEPLSVVGSNTGRFGIGEVRFPEDRDLSTHCLYVCHDGPAQDDLARLVREVEERAMPLVRHPSYPTAGPHSSLYLSRIPAALAAVTSSRKPVFPEFSASLALRPRVVPGAGVARDDRGRPVLYWPETATTRLLSAEAARLLELCSGEASLEEICTTWVAEGCGRALQAWLVAKELWEAGLLTN